MREFSQVIKNRWPGVMGNPIGGAERMTKYEQAQNRICNLLKVANYHRTVRGNNPLAVSLEIKASIIKHRADAMSVEEASHVCCN